MEYANARSGRARRGRIGNEDTSFIRILTPVLLPHLQQVFKQGHPVFFHRGGIEEFFVMLNPATVLETFFGVVAGRVAVIGFDEGLHFMVFL